MSQPPISDIAPDRRWVAVDAMGGDKGPEEVVAGVSLALRQHPSIQGIYLVGRTEVLEPLVAQHGLWGCPKVEIRHATDVVEMTDKPRQALKQKKDASMFRAMEMVRSGEANGMVSCGNTGALYAAGSLRLRTMEGVERPALAPIMPTQDHHFVLLDAGANPESTHVHLVHNAILGAHYCRIVLGKEKPRIGLLTIGTEEGKGNEVTQQAHQVLKQINGTVHYTGLIEGFHVFDNHVDVVVCDGHVGNILLKTCEGLYKALKKFASDEIKKNPVRVAGYLMMKGAFGAMKARLSPDNYGGAPLLGLKRTVIKAHGSANRFALCSAVHIASQVLEHDLQGHAAPDIAKANALIAAAEAAASTVAVAPAA